MINLWTREEYHKKLNWKERYWLEDCPFCTNIKEQEGHIIWKWKCWYIMHNMYPYSWNEKHLMAIPYTHKKCYLDLSDEEILDFKNVNIFLKEFFGEDNYFSCLRETIANRSVEHLHYHYIPWKLKWKYLRKMLMDQWFPIKEEL